MDIRPTFHCFDDALELINERVLKDPSGAPWPTVRLVHGLARGENGERYAHAWVEEDGRCWDAGLVEGQRIYFAVPRDEFYAARQIHRTTVYTVRQACLENLTSGHYGPWRWEYRACCGRGEKIVGSIPATIAPGALREDS